MLDAIFCKITTYFQNNCFHGKKICCHWSKSFASFRKKHLACGTVVQRSFLRTYVFHLYIYVYIPKSVWSNTGEKKFWSKLSFMYLLLLYEYTMHM
jgi:hypothetical protein